MCGGHHDFILAIHHDIVEVLGEVFDFVVSHQFTLFTLEPLLLFLDGFHLLELALQHEYGHNTTKEHIDPIISGTNNVQTVLVAIQRAMMPGIARRKRKTIGRTFKRNSTISKQVEKLVRCSPIIIDCPRFG